jgi:hypothetical protein
MGTRMEFANQCSAKETMMFELSTANKWEFSGGANEKDFTTTNGGFWDRNRKEIVSDDGNGSEEGIFCGNGTAGVAKNVETVSVTVMNDAAKGYEGDVSRENNVAKFEHV